MSKVADDENNKTPPETFTLVCPWCEADPVTVNVRNLNFPNGIVLLLASCGGCRKILGVSFAGIAPPQIVRAGRIIQ